MKLEKIKIWESKPAIKKHDKRLLLKTVGETFLWVPLFEDQICKNFFILTNLRWKRKNVVLLSLFYLSPNYMHIFSFTTN